MARTTRPANPRTLAWPWGWKGRGDPKQPGDPKGQDQPKPTTPATDPNATDAQVAALQRRCTVAIDRRLGQLGALTGRVAGAPNLTGAHQAALAGIVSSASVGLGQLKTTIAADTDLATLQGHCREIVTGYLVYALVTPQVHIVVAADNVAAAADRLDQAAAKLADAIAAAKAAGTDTSAAEAKLADMQREIAAGRAAVAGVAGPVLALTPSSAGSIAGVLGSARAALGTAEAHLAAAGRDGAQAAAALRGAGKHDHEGSDASNLGWFAGERF